MRMWFAALWLSGLCILTYGIQMAVGTEPLLLIDSLKWEEPWRLVTAIFAHANPAHLLSNLFALSLFGTLLESRIGSRRLFLLFFVAGILINMASPYERSLGASGAVYAILGSLVVLRPWMTVWVAWLPMPMVVAGLFWFLQDLLGVFYPSSSGVANLAHIGGLLIGLLTGVVWYRRFGDPLVRRENRQKDRELEKQLDEWERKYMRLR